VKIFSEALHFFLMNCFIKFSVLVMGVVKV